ncbi:hypothetical protein FACS1894166_11850 [Bacilli bacterium]|nr:hypothetical protein FACS1894166_11850 [Bacilli bacterium]
MSLSATIDNVPVDDINIFDPATGIICYKNGNLEYKTITVVAEDGTAIPQSIKIGFDQIIPNPLRTLSLFPFTDHPNSYNQGVATYKSGVTQISFNTYDNPKLYISLQDYTDDQKLE